MIITLKGASFTNNIGALDAWPIQTVVNGGVLTSLPSSSSIKKDDTAGLVLDYFYDTTKYTHGSVTIISNESSVGYYNGFPEVGKIQVNIPAGNTLSAKVVVTINLTAISSGGGEEDGDETYTITYKYMSGSTEIKTATTETVAAGTNKTFSTSNAPAISGYTVSSVSPTSATVNENITVTYYYTAINTGDGSTITTTYTNAGYILASNGSLTGATSTWVHSDFIPISSLADNHYGICVGTFVGHGTVAAIAFYTEKDNYNSFTEGYILSSTSANKTTQSAAEVKANITNNSAQYVVFSTDGSKATLSVTTSEGSTITPEPEEPENPSTGTSGVNYYDEAGFISISTGQVTNPTSDWIHSDFIAIDSLVDDADLGHCIGKLTGHSSVADIAFYSAPNFSSFIVGKSSAGATKTVATLQALMTELNATNATHIVISTDKTKNQLYASLK